MASEVRWVCPNGCGAGYVVNNDGPNECAECGSDTIRPDQSTLGDL